MNLIRIERVQELTTFGKSTIWELSAEEGGTFPKPEKLSARVTVWIEEEIIAWIKLQFENNAKERIKRKSSKIKKSCHAQ